MTRKLTDLEIKNFQEVGFETMQESAYAHLEDLGFGISIEADGALMIQARCASGKWRWVHEAQYETALIAACAAADIIHNLAGVNLFAATKGA